MMNYLFKVGRGVALTFSAIAIIGLSNAGYADPGSLTMGYLDRTLGARQLAAQDYAGTVEVLSPVLSIQTKYEQATNLCVANTMLGQFSKAERQCSKASRYARSQNSIQNYGLTSRDRRALALNNLGVLRVLQGNNDEAVALFKEAASREARAMNNLAAVEQAVSSEDRDRLAVLSPPSPL